MTKPRIVRIEIPAEDRSVNWQDYNGTVWEPKSSGFWVDESIEDPEERIWVTWRQLLDEAGQIGLTEVTSEPVEKAYRIAYRRGYNAAQAEHEDDWS